ncbi:MAG TPA: hypothetical protein VNM92_01440 [Thermoanaerobaculia bacterium]|nr:hypothetical protein [Thermoanaerobaculia bacterium]
MKRVIEAVAETFEIEVATLRETHGGVVRMLAAWIGWNEAVLRLREIAAALRLPSSGYISTLVRECDEQLARDKLLQSIAGRAIDALHLA